MAKTQDYYIYTPKTGWILVRIESTCGSNEYIGLDYTKTRP